jgi:hypothetical protein
MLRPVRFPMVLCAAALCTVLAVPVASAVAATPIAQTAGSCMTTPGSLAGGYVLVAPGANKGVSCANRKGLITGFQACRLKHGQQGKCTSKILGFTCKEAKRNYASEAGVVASFFTKVTCTKGSESFAWTYEQFVG